jgi:hypothetical protein
LGWEVLLIFGCLALPKNHCHRYTRISRPVPLSKAHPFVTQNVYDHGPLEQNNLTVSGYITQKEPFEFRISGINPGKFYTLNPAEDFSRQQSSPLCEPDILSLCVISRSKHGSNSKQLTVLKSDTLESDKSLKWRVFAATDALSFEPKRTLYLISKSDGFV